MAGEPEPDAEQLALAQRELTEGRYQAALAHAKAMLAATPEHLDALYIKAVSERYLGDFDAAEKSLATLIQTFPEYGRAYQERGHILKAKNALDAATKAYQYATQCNPALVASWRGIAALTQANAPGLSAHAAAQARRLETLPKALLAASNHIHEGRLLKAEDICRAFLQKNPTHVEGMRLLADIGVRLSVLEDAEFLLESALELEPENIQVRLDYIEVLRKRQKFENALREAQRLHAQEPDNPLFQSHLAVESMQVGDYETAIGLFDSVLEKAPNDPATLTSKGHALKTYGRQDEAIAVYRTAVRVHPSHGDAYYALANLKTYRFTDEEVAAMSQEVSRPGTPLRQAIHFYFALGKAFEDRRDFDRSFEHYREGNELKRRQTRYRGAQMDAEFEAQKAVCTPALFERQSGKGFGAPDPIFVVGLPRAGSTLIEQILASHSAIDGTLELPNILSLAHRLRSRGPIAAQSAYPQILAELTETQMRDFGREYIEQTRIHRQGAPYFVDKMPNNFRHIGLIHLILPNAKIIDARREPMACCFSGFKQLFAEGQEFTYGLDEIGRYYRGYVDLMAHWDAVLPGKVLRVQYEDVLDNLEAQVRRILDYCGLPFEEACVEFHRTKRSVRTASSEQVRQPLYTSSVDEWRNYESHLGPLKDALGPALTEYRA